MPAASRLLEHLRFCDDFRRFAAQCREDGRLQVRWADRRALMDDRDNLAGFDRHYFYHVAWAARALAETRPAEHVDVSSHLPFVAAVSAFVRTRFFELRDPRLSLDGLTSGRADLTALPFADDSLPSVSCLHVVEHVGLGRYGDPIDARGDRRALAELGRVVAPGGQLLIAVPVGRPRVVFNAHRIYSCEYIVEALPGLVLREFTLIPDRPETGDLVRHASFALAASQDYACGCFRFSK